MTVIYYEVRSKKSPTGEGWRVCKEPYLNEQTAMDHAKLLMRWNWVKDVQVFKITEEDLPIDHKEAQS